MFRLLSRLNILWFAPKKKKKNCGLQLACYRTILFLAWMIGYLFCGLRLRKCFVIGILYVNFYFFIFSFNIWYLFLVLTFYH